ncbi:microsomal dipeptidase [Ceraceosorus bombacis]|uniref:Dipeptidase n=1 Tax=Ceraceosorus bombacis TaxID=401625 RepID=A0A0P1BQ15_9BASI|nr:microsomal dipeptidase [Ceraceosorus bombacis]
MKLFSDLVGAATCASGNAISAALVPLIWASSYLQTDPLAVAHSILRTTPLIDGHVDLPVLFRYIYGGDLASPKVDYKGELQGFVDLPRLRKGGSGGFFSIAYVPCTKIPEGEKEDFNAPTWQVRDTLEQIDLTWSLAEYYPDDVAVVTTPQELRSAFKSGKISHLIGIEGAHSLGNSLSTLRTYHRLGARYLTLTHTCHNAFADSAGATAGQALPPLHGGLTKIGFRLIDELNRLGMMADLSHTSDDTAKDVIKHTKAPFFFSHSGARAVHDHIRNVPDALLDQARDSGKDGIVMVAFLYPFVGPEGDAGIAKVADHIDHIASKIGRSKVGIGSDYDGGFKFADGLEDVSTYPKLVAELFSRGWSRNELRGLVGENLIRVLGETIRVGDEMRANGALPDVDTIDGRPDNGPGKPTFDSEPCKRSNAGLVK